MVPFKGWQRWQGECWALVLGLVLGWGFPAQAAEGKCYMRNYTFNFLAENDLWEVVRTSISPMAPACPS
jgi:hypothetical protein